MWIEQNGFQTAGNSKRSNVPKSSTAQGSRLVSRKRQRLFSTTHSAFLWRYPRPKSVNHVITRKTSYMQELTIRNPDAALKRNNCFCTLSTLSLVLGCILINFRRMVSSQWVMQLCAETRHHMDRKGNLSRTTTHSRSGVPEVSRDSTRVWNRGSSTHCPKLIWAKIVQTCLLKTLSVWLSFLISRSCWTLVISPSHLQTKKLRKHNRL